MRSLRKANVSRLPCTSDGCCSPSTVYCVCKKEIMTWLKVSSAVSTASGRCLWAAVICLVSAAQSLLWSRLWQRLTATAYHAGPCTMSTSAGRFYLIYWVHVNALDMPCFVKYSEPNTFLVGTAKQRLTGGGLLCPLKATDLSNRKKKDWQIISFFVEKKQ